MGVLSAEDMERLAKCEAARRTSERYHKLTVRLYLDGAGKWHCRFHDTAVTELDGMAVELVASYRNGHQV